MPMSGCKIIVISLSIILFLTNVSATDFFRKFMERKFHTQQPGQFVEENVDSEKEIKPLFEVPSWTFHFNFPFYGSRPKFPSPPQFPTAQDLDNRGLGMSEYYYEDDENQEANLESGGVTTTTLPLTTTSAVVPKRTKGLIKRRRTRNPRTTESVLKGSVTLQSILHPGNLHFEDGTKEPQKVLHSDQRGLVNDSPVSEHSTNQISKGSHHQDLHATSDHTQVVSGLMHTTATMHEFSQGLDTTTHISTTNQELDKHHISNATHSTTETSHYSTQDTPAPPTYEPKHHINETGHESTHDTSTIGHEVTDHTSISSQEWTSQGVSIAGHEFTPSTPTTEGTGHISTSTFNHESTTAVPIINHKSAHLISTISQDGTHTTVESTTTESTASSTGYISTTSDASIHHTPTIRNGLTHDTHSTSHGSTYTAPPTSYGPKYNASMISHELINNTSVMLTTPEPYDAAMTTTTHAIEENLVHDTVPTTLHNSTTGIIVTTELPHMETTTMASSMYHSTAENHDLTHSQTTFESTVVTEHNAVTVPHFIGSTEAINEIEHTTQASNSIPESEEVSTKSLNETKHNINNHEIIINPTSVETSTMNSEENRQPNLSTSTLTIQTTTLPKDIEETNTTGSTLKISDGTVVSTTTEYISPRHTLHQNLDEMSTTSGSTPTTLNASHPAISEIAGDEMLTEALQHLTDVLRNETIQKHSSSEKPGESGENHSTQSDGKSDLPIMMAEEFMTTEISTSINPTLNTTTSIILDNIIEGAHSPADSLFIHTSTVATVDEHTTILTLEHDINSEEHTTSSTGVHDPNRNSDFAVTSNPDFNIITENTRDVMNTGLSPTNNNNFEKKKSETGENNLGDNSNNQHTIEISTTEESASIGNNDNRESVAVTTVLPVPKRIPIKEKKSAHQSIIKFSKLIKTSTPAPINDEGPDEEKEMETAHNWADGANSRVENPETAILEEDSKSGKIPRDNTVDRINSI